MKYLLATNIIYTIKNKPPLVRTAFNKPDGQMVIASVSFMQFIYGGE